MSSLRWILQSISFNSSNEVKVFACKIQATSHCACSIQAMPYCANMRCILQQQQRADPKADSPDAPAKNLMGDLFARFPADAPAWGALRVHTFVSMCSWLCCFQTF